MAYVIVKWYMRLLHMCPLKPFYGKASLGQLKSFNIYLWVGCLQGRPYKGHVPRANPKS